MALLYSLPIILSGYLFLHISPYHKRNIQRRHGQYTYFRFISYGIPLTFFASLIVAAINSSEINFISVGNKDIAIDTFVNFAGNQLRSFAQLVQPTDVNAAHIANICKVTITSSLLAIIASCFLELYAYLIHGEDKDYELSIRNISDPSTRMLYRATKESKLMLFCLENRKAYIGYPVSIESKDDDSPSSGKYVSILPLLSGYRSETRLDLKLRHGYHIDEYETPDEDIRITINLDKINTMSYFDLEVFQSVDDQSKS